MTLQATKTHLIQLLAEPENRVIAFSGKWGTGKSHMWRELKEASNDSSVKNALYVSLFGLGDMSQVKLKIVQAAIPNAEANPGFWDGVMTGVTGIRKALEGFHKGFSGLSEFALLAVPAILRNKMIVLDDIERKHQNLSIDEVLGFIDEFTQQYGARFVLILNSDQLENKTIWDTLHEKVVDQEIRLDTSPSEAFDIAIGLTPSTYGARIKEPVEVCRLTNIRIIRKVIRAVNRILGARKTLSDAVLMRVIPSTVLLAAINYKGIENGPDFNFVLNCGSSTDWEDWEKKEEELDEGGKRRAKWRLLMKELGIMISDDYELIVIEYLRSGLFDDRAVSEIIDRYVAEDKAMEARELARQFQDHAIWHYKLTKSELLAEAKELGEVAHLLDPYSVTSVHKLLSEIQGCKEVADGMIESWIVEFKKRPPQEIGSENFFNRSVHPLIQAEFDAIKSDAQANTTLFDACEKIVERSGWGPREEIVMRSATVNDFEEAIKTLEIKELQLFMRQFLEMCLQQGNYEKPFGSAVAHFKEACRNICVDPNSSGLGKLIRLLFDDAKLGSALNSNPSEIKPATESDAAPSAAATNSG